MAGFLYDDLKKIVEQRGAVLVIGSGVAAAATRGAEVSTWGGLLKHGIGRCKDLGRVNDAWCKRALEDIAMGDVHDWVTVAEKVTNKLSNGSDAEYARWLEDTVGALRVVDPALVEAIAGLGLPIVTTNYDDLIEQVTGYPAITWDDTRRVEKLLRGEERSVLHLHGHWRSPRSVVLGVASYERVLGSDLAQTTLHALRATSSLVYVGFGAGLSDANFSALREWSRKVFAAGHYRHYRLALEDQVAPLQKEHPADERVFVVSYGATHGELHSFLRSLAALPVTADPR